MSRFLPHTNIEVGRKNWYIVLGPKIFETPKVIKIFII